MYLKMPLWLPRYVARSFTLNPVATVIYPPHFDNEVLFLFDGDIVSLHTVSDSERSYSTRRAARWKVLIRSALSKSSVSPGSGHTFGGHFASASVSFSLVGPFLTLSAGTLWLRPRSESMPLGATTTRTSSTSKYILYPFSQ